MNMSVLMAFIHASINIFMVNLEICTALVLLLAIVDIEVDWQQQTMYCKTILVLLATTDSIIK